MITIEWRHFKVNILSKIQESTRTRDSSIFRVMVHILQNKNGQNITFLIMDYYTEESIKVLLLAESIEQLLITFTKKDLTEVNVLLKNVLVLKNFSTKLKPVIIGFI